MEIFKTLVLMGILTFLFVFAGIQIAGEQGAIMAFLVALGMNFFSYFFSDKLILSRYKAVQVNENSASGLLSIVRNLCQKSNMPMPKVYIIPEQTPNAFATGRNPNNAAVAVTEGLLNLLNKDEIEGVLAHELSHVRHYDILTGSIAAVIAGAIAMLANFAKLGMARQSNQKQSGGVGVIVLAIIMPLAATIIQMAISREREYKADKGAALITGKPEHLASALAKLENYAGKLAMKNANEQSAHMFIVNPFGSLKNTLGALFRTHPLTSDRIAQLEKISKDLKRQ